MTPERTEIIGPFVVKEFYWTGEYVVYVNDHLTPGSFDDIVRGLKDKADKGGDEKE